MDFDYSKLTQVQLDALKGAGGDPVEMANVKQRLERLTVRINVEDYGADNTGAKDSYRAFQDAIDHLAQNSYNVLFIPAGVYKISQSLKIPEPRRLNTAATEGFGVYIKGSGMYSTTLVYDGTDYCFTALTNDMAEDILFSDMNINAVNGGAIMLPQGAHQMFERLSVSAVGVGKIGVLIEGMRGKPTPERPDPATAGYGSYMVSFEKCRFWQEYGGFKATAVKVMNSVLCTTFRSCFFSRAFANYTTLHLMNCDTVVIDNCAFERSELPTFEENAQITAPLITLDACHAVDIRQAHIEFTFESFVYITGHTSGVHIDAPRIAHYAIQEFNPNKGYLVVVDDNSTSSRFITISDRGYRTQVNHAGSIIGPEWIDNVGCVSIDDHYDYTPYNNENSHHERRSVPWIGRAGTNILRNPALVSRSRYALPDFVEIMSGTWEWDKDDLYKTGTIVKQTAASGKNAMRLRTTETMDKYKFYTFVIVARNLSGKSDQLWVDIGGDTNDFVVITPSGPEMFTQTHRFLPKYSDVVDIVVYNPVNIEILAIYVLPGLVSSIPYGVEMQASSTVDAVDLRGLVLQLRPSTALPTAGWDYRGQIMRIEKDGQDDALYICKRKADGSFAWEVL